jgi:hypothetical protein
MAKRTASNRVRTGVPPDRDPRLLQSGGADDGGELIAGMAWSGHWYLPAARGTFDPSFVWEAGIPTQDLTPRAGETLTPGSLHLIGYRRRLDDGGNACRRYFYDSAVR